MRFCPTCGKALIPVKKESGVVFQCRKCGYETQEDSVKVLVRKSGAEKVVTSSGMKDESNPLPTIQMRCGRCGNLQAYYWFAQTVGDHAGLDQERSTRFFRCTRCNNTWRES